LVQLTDRDRELLAFVSEHRMVLGEHVQKLLGVSEKAVGARLRSLTAAGLLRRVPVFHRPGDCHQITGKGLAVIGSKLPRPRTDLRSYEHDVGVAWLWLAARAGTFGALREIISERSMRSHDATEDGRQLPLSVRLGGVGRGGRERLHYPDLLLVDVTGKRVAFELELSGKARTRREMILAGYGADARIDGVVYLVDNPAVWRGIEESARKLGIAERVHVQRVRLGGSRAAPPGSTSRVAHRTRDLGLTGASSR
jgi:hypothetical protein